MPTDHQETLLGVAFRDPKLLQQALLHRSFVNEEGLLPNDSYERMEFLGDAVLELIISTEIYQGCPAQGEGDLTKGRAALVCRETLARVARRLGLGQDLQLGKGEEVSGGRDRDSILAAAFEAVVAAVYLDRGYDEARKFILRVMAQELEECSRGGTPPENPKSRLQEYVQGSGRPTPRYRVVSSEGPDHGPVFTIEVLVEDEVVGVGRGGKKTDAEGAAASDALANLALGSRATGKL